MPSAFRTIFAAAGALLAVLLSAPAVRAQEAPRPVEVMILGVYHFDNPGLDLANVEVDDVTTPRRQAELEAMSAALMRFRPTRIAIEDVGAAPDLRLAAYDSFTNAALRTIRNENVQIGFRLAHAASLHAVYGVDERSDGVDYFPFEPVQNFAAAHGRSAEIDAAIAEITAETEAFGAGQGARTISQSLRLHNEPARSRAEQRHFYYGLMDMTDGAATPGADLNAAWYLRNARIFAKIVSIAQPGDRIVVVFGAGHAYWLRHFVEMTPGFVLVEANDYLPE